ncbi:hypothetical protein, partial [Streptococcus anginosus]|uniref:hypothetical protein n=1 Tax=Streptococcus anginosus TaxID=1328 RepID=UPI002ED9FC71
MTGFRPMNSKIHPNFGFDKFGYPNVDSRATKANPVFQIENLVIQNLTREKSIRKNGFSDEWKGNICYL